MYIDFFCVERYFLILLYLLFDFQDESDKILNTMDTPKEILICVKTYPEYSAKYTETVCIAGILKESRRIIRLLN
jgi:hypothetical protein